MKNKLALVLLVLIIVFFIIDAFVGVNKIIRNIVYGIMAVVGIYYLISHKNDNGLNDMFKDKEDDIN